MCARLSQISAKTMGVYGKETLNQGGGGGEGGAFYAFHKKRTVTKRPNC